jgi:glucose-6-phosphate 1-dehydrogenase
MSGQTPQLEPSIIVIFGITGDLSQRYLLPALYHLIKEGTLHDKTEIVGISRSDIGVEAVLDKADLCKNEEGGICDPDALQKMRDQTRMVQMDVADQTHYASLLKTLNEIEDEAGLCMNRLYYLSIPPQVYGPIITMMGQEGLHASCQHGTAQTRLMVEKPFGYDSESAQNLIAETGKVFNEDQIFRIDHYLAKTTVQNILKFRFQNPAFESLWSADYISSIEISASEQIGIEGRAQFYEPLGALRDFIQSHLLQILAIVTMDHPISLDSDAIHANKQTILQEVLAVPRDKVAEYAIREQYAGYREEVKNPGSETETFAAIKVFIRDQRWRGVPLLLWTGKALKERKSEIVITFKAAAGRPARLYFRIQPNEGIEIDLGDDTSQQLQMLQEAIADFSYTKSLDSHNRPNAYEKVLADAIRGDHTLFATSQEVLEAWRIVQPVLDTWHHPLADIKAYAPGSDPAELLEPLGEQPA